MGRKEISWIENMIRKGIPRINQPTCYKLLMHTAVYALLYLNVPFLCGKGRQTLSWDGERIGEREPELQRGKVLGESHV